VARALIRIARLKDADSSIKRAARRAAGMRRIGQRLVWPSVPECGSLGLRSRSKLTGPQLSVMTRCEWYSCVAGKRVARLFGVGPCLGILAQEGSRTLALALLLLRLLQQTHAPS
jgi:hypothetical protein